MVPVALESVFSPIPSEVVLASAGFVAGRGDAWLPMMVLAATVGSLIGAWALYAIGALVGPERLRAFVVTHGRWIRVSERDLDRAERWFDRHATWAVLLGRCVPLVRSIVSIPAGFRRMPLVPFTVCTLIGSLVWNTAIISAGFVMGDNWVAVQPYLEVAQLVVVVAFAGFVVHFLARRLPFSPWQARDVDGSHRPRSEGADRP